ncbi:threonine synthase [Myroides phaeus]|uniref:threonine synthase n=1 Tax=Myroides phaeus TaxID=702745 RepID=UPI0013031C1F|nr:threonine synthase [Myroides phaeus]
MRYYSITNPELQASFKEAAISGIAPDRGLYFPMEIPKLDKEFIDTIENYSNHEIAYKVIKPFVGDEMSDEALKQLVAETLCFDFPIVEVEEDVASLELYHGPTLAFKDVGARFMSRCLQAFTKEENKNIKVLVATSGDTGGAVANGFYGVNGVEVVILYPSGKVSSIQEKQLTTLGGNIRAVEVNGSFDDCQEMVKTAFLDQELKDCNLTSANSINVARWLPQMFYYFFAYKALKGKGKPIVVTVPSGNFGNICAGMLAQRMGLPIEHFVAATNINDTVPRFMKTQDYKPNKTQETISNAMDVSNPSNFIRIFELFERQYGSLSNVFSSYSFDDMQTKATLKKVYEERGYLLDPHGAVGYLGLTQFMAQHKGYTGVFLETAHPVKFPESIEQTLGIEIPVPEALKPLMTKEKQSVVINTYNELKQYLLE